ncbi:twitchin-like [Diaphorina citri]|uniref:Twitchin-like n=1 Tax=Diaphorina citri TaxID=121845 RepID=A0A3Q0J4R3_DIACI|nr:twitchin-like [Diaphorina citri]
MVSRWVPSQANTAWAISMAPHIDRRHLGDIKLSAGTTLKFDANIIGEPVPHVDWRAGGNPLNLRPIWEKCAQTEGDTPKGKVLDLIEGNQYEFRVLAVNKGGPGEPSDPTAPHPNPIWEKCAQTEGDTPKGKVLDLIEGNQYEFRVLAVNKGGPGEPSDPTAPHIARAKKVLLCPIWEKCAQTEGDTPKGKVLDLIEGNQYEFRVLAVNKGGPGEPSDPTAPHIARAKKVSPYINRDQLSDIKVRAGSNFEFDINVIGEPIPTKEWLCNDITIISKDRFKIVNDDKSTKLKVFDSKRGDSGIYTLAVKNSWGTDKGTAKVTVLDIPSPPEGPLKPSNITKSSCNLEWRAPRDDGGTDILHYVVEKMDMETGRWVPMGDVSGTYTRAENLIEGHDYNFRVKAVNKIGESLPLVCQSPITAKDPFGRPDRPGQPTVTDWGKDHVDLEWTPPKKDGGSPISQYIIEKKPKYGPWEKACIVPANITATSVPDLKEGEEYEFRVIAVNKGGPGEPSKASAPVTCKPRFVAPVIDQYALQDMTVKAGTRPTSSLSKAQEYNPFITLLFKNFVLDLNEDVPGKPSKPEATDVDKDHIKIKWQQPISNGGSAIKGYEVERRERTSGRWIKITPDPIRSNTKFLNNKVMKGLYSWAFEREEVGRQPCQKTEPHGRGS